MITTAEGFAQAIRDKKRQRGVVIFPAPFSIFMNEDIAVNGGIEFTELLNSDENLTIGRAVQSEVNVSLINSNKLLSSVDFTQEFTVALGVETATGSASVRSGATLAVKVGNNVITASPSWTRVYFNSTAYTISGTAAALFVYENSLFVIGNTGTIIKAYTINSNSLTSVTTPNWSAYMLDKAKKWAADGTCLSYVGGVMYDCSVSGSVMTYKTSQFVKLGHFVGSKPDKVKTQIVSLSGYDLMQKFEKDAAGYFDSLTYPATLGSMFTALCTYCGVSAGDTSKALNMNKQFDVAPIDNDITTCRQVLAYIAEAAGCYARISRDGKCELVWYSLHNGGISTEYERVLNPTTPTKYVELTAGNFFYFDDGIFISELVVGAEYRVTYNGKTYDCIGVTNEQANSVFLGNTTWVDIPGNEDIPFCIYDTLAILSYGFDQQVTVTIERIHRTSSPGGYRLAKGDYFDINVAEYTVQKINKLQSHVSQDDVGVIVGSGMNCYDIVDNPYLNGATDAEIRPWVENIYNRLAAFNEYSPVNVSCESNWALQSGDIVMVETDEGDKLLPIFAQTISWSGNARAVIESTGEQTRGVMTAVNREKIENGRHYFNLEKTVEGLALEVGLKVSQKEVDASIDAIETFENTAVRIDASGVHVKTTGEIDFVVDDVLRAHIDETGLNSPRVVVTEEFSAPNAVLKNLSSAIPWQGSIQASLDAAPKWLTGYAELFVHPGTYQEDIVIRGFKGAQLGISLYEGVTINGSITIEQCDNVRIASSALGQAKIYPRDARNVISARNVGMLELNSLQISGYRQRASAQSGTATGVEMIGGVLDMSNCCVEYTRDYGVLFYMGASGTVNDCIGGLQGGDYRTNANLGYGILGSSGCHFAVLGRCPRGNTLPVSAWLSTVYGADAVTPTDGGMEYVAPTEITKTFAISKHCTYLYGVRRIRDDQATTFSQGYYGEYVAGTNNWRIGAMWFADAASALAGKTITSARLTMRRASGGWSSTVGVYLGTVALEESSFTSTLKPEFTNASPYPIASLARETEATYDVTSLISAIQAGQAIGVYEPARSYSGNYSPAYTQFYGKGSGFEPLLTVTYK